MLGTSVMLAGCTTPFAGSTGINWYGKPAAGTITVSDPKMYRREALINERNKDIAWLDGLINDSATVVFKPEIAREIEQISALSAALGLSFDPASGLNYRRAKETGDLQQQIDVVQLQLQLDQLKRDADLVRKTFDAQAQPVNVDPNKLADGSPGTATSGTPAAAADQLTAAIDKLTAALGDRLGADAKGAAVPANVGANPADLFRDRAAYRDLLKTARNAASLDELHDAGGDALIRLNFQATVLPDRRHSDVPGVIQMKVVAPVMSEPEKTRFYRGWLSYINAGLNIENGLIWKPNASFLAYGVADNFDLVYFSFAPPKAPPAVPAAAPAKTAKPAQAKGGKKPTPVAAPVPASAAAVCRGLILDPQVTDEAGCETLTFAVPKFLGTSPQEGPYSDLKDYLAAFQLASNDAIEQQEFQAARSDLVDHPDRFVSNCVLARPTDLSQPGRPDTLYSQLDTTSRRLLRERVRAAGGAVLSNIDRLARAMLEARGIKPPADSRMDLVATRAARAEILLRTLERFTYPAECTPSQRGAFREGGGSVYVPPRFEEAITREADRIAVYDIGPREQVQQVSTIARAANSLSLALSVAASDPTSGAAANAAAGYSRQAIGRAETLERLPAVVGYSVIARKTFGWVIGPRALVNPKGDIKLDQNLRTYDLTVDLSVPSWWPSFCLETVTGWAPKPRQIADAGADFELASEDVTAGSIGTCNTIASGAGTETGKTVRYVKAAKVSLSPNDADYAQLTTYLSLGGIEERRRVALEDSRLSGQAVSACRPTSLIVRGDSVWRTSEVIIGGAKLGAAAITVAPDMAGVIVDVPALDEKVGAIPTAKIPFRLLTPYGVAPGEVDYAPKPAEGCKPQEKKGEDGASVTSFTPTAFSVPSLQVFNFTGAKLDQIDAATLNGQPGKVDKVAGGKALKVTFTRDQTEGLPVSRTVPLVLFKGTEQAVVKTVEVTANNGDQ
ncbi:hypothetical protein [Sphingomonas sp. dw_22]|uniref:hypothetical protein n=1 Tax=Sphingomonas sp. dw_22 TaxID=2721175 RepID=UPI001BD4F022|nr:hypothetical protein [Sphingomonas sp. dw_22]